MQQLISPIPAKSCSKVLKPKLFRAVKFASSWGQTVIIGKASKLAKGIVEIDSTVDLANSLLTATLAYK